MDHKEIIKWAEMCPTQSCSTEDHNGCPYGDGGLIDCVDRLDSDVIAALQEIVSDISPDRLEEICKAERENRLLILPAPIGAPVYIPYKYADEDEPEGDAGVEESRMAGYINEDGREFYLVYQENCGGTDIEPARLHITRESAEAALAGMLPE